MVQGLIVLHVATRGSKSLTSSANKEDWYKLWLCVTDDDHKVRWGSKSVTSLANK